ncbi:MAG: sensor histidine kinase [Candidatus Zhuqueibacterota bacterium]
MKSKRITGIVTITLLAIALLGIVSLQTYLLKHGLFLEKEIFHQNVKAALNSIVQKLETAETARRVFKVSLAMDGGSKNEMRRYRLSATDSVTTGRQPMWQPEDFDEPKVTRDSSRISIQFASPQPLQLSVLDSSGQEISSVMQQKMAGRSRIFILSDSALLKGNYHLTLKSDSLSYVIHMENGRMRGIEKDEHLSNQRFALVTKVIDDMTVIKPRPILERVRPAALDSAIHITLTEKGIRTPYNFGILAPQSDSVIYASPGTMDIGKLIQSRFRTPLFPNDLFASNHQLILYFPNQTSYIFSRVWLMAMLSLFFFSIIIFCLVYVLRALFKQQAFSRQLTDFINNMTHEFKTPISTISLVSETLTNPAILSDEAKIVKYGSIIRDESSRMRQQVEKILQMAELEEGDFELKKSDVDVHLLIEHVIKNFALALEKRNGAVRTRFDAPDAVVSADSVHLENVIHNLFDNAVKYCRQEPVIEIATSTEGSALLISISDNGIGLSPEQQKRVFEKYYRVPTGNVHNVKGFGIGLSYVRIIVAAHQGAISVASQPGVGSRFTIQLPLRDRK